MKNTIVLFIFFIGVQAFAEKYSAQCMAGPILATETDSCYPEPGMHIANGYDKALKCASQKALSQCEINSKTSCQISLIENLGFGPNPNFPSGNSGVCRVRVTADSID
jgi:hypothetical protein